MVKGKRGFRSKTMVVWDFNAIRRLHHEADLDYYFSYLAAYTTFMNSSKPLSDPSIDSHLCSGVYLSIGVCNMILSMMPDPRQTLRI
jgi:hypothetical protein